MLFNNFFLFIVLSLLCSGAQKELGKTKKYDIIFVLCTVHLKKIHYLPSNEVTFEEVRHRLELLRMNCIFWFVCTLINSL